MSIELSRDANRLIEDIELELASIRAAMALRPLQPAHATLPGAQVVDDPGTPPVRKIGPFDLTRSGAETPALAPPVSAASPDAAAEPPEKQKRMTLQERLASMQGED